MLKSKQRKRSNYSIINKVSTLITDSEICHNLEVSASDKNLSFFPPDSLSTFAVVETSCLAEWDTGIWILFVHSLFSSMTETNHLNS